MKAETKIYSDFIKRNKIVVREDYFFIPTMAIVQLAKGGNGRWYADNDDASITKKSAVYFYCKNHFENLK